MNEVQYSVEHKVSPQMLYEIGANASALSIIRGYPEPSSEDLVLAGRCLLSMDLLECANEYFARAQQLGDSGGAAFYAEFRDDEPLPDRVTLLQRLSPMDGGFEPIVQMWQCYLDGNYEDCAQRITELRLSNLNIDYLDGVSGLLELQETNPDWSRATKLLEIGRKYSSAVSSTLASLCIQAGDLKRAERVLREAVACFGFFDLTYELGDLYRKELGKPSEAFFWYSVGIAHGYLGLGRRIARLLHESWPDDRQEADGYLDLAEAGSQA